VPVIVFPTGMIYLQATTINVMPTVLSGEVPAFRGTLSR